MEFKYRAVDDGPTPKQTSFPPCPPPISTITFFSDQSLRGGFSGMIPGPKPNVIRIPASSANAGEARLREMEKARIRREIIAAEVARRIQLEEEVRRELALERGWVVPLPMPRNLGAAAAAHGFSPFDERAAMRLNSARVGPLNVPKPPLPERMPPPEIMEPPVENNKDKVIVLAKPDPDLYAAKRKAVTPAADSSEGLEKKPKAEWSCALCQVSATSERGLNDHLKGRKHKAKEASLRPQKVGKGTGAPQKSKKFAAKADRQPLQPQPAITSGDIDQTMINKGVEESKNEAQLMQNINNNIQVWKNEGGTAIETGPGAGRMNAPKGTVTKFWCEICQVGAHSPVVFTNHKLGRRHLKRMKKLVANGGSSSLASPVSPQEAPLLIKEADAVNQEKTVIVAENL